MEQQDPDTSQQLWHLKILAHALVDAKNCRPAGAQPVFLRRELPPALARVAASICGHRQVWLAWTCGRAMGFVVAEMACEATSESAAIRMFFYDLDGRMQASGVWALRNDGRWDLLSVDSGR